MHFTLIVVVPVLMPVTTPLLDTVAIFELEEVKVTLFEGVALTFKAVFDFLRIVTLDFVTVRVGFFTIILHLAVRPFALMVIVADPAFFAVTLPVRFTVATFELRCLSI